MFLSSICPPQHLSIQTAIWQVPYVPDLIRGVSTSQWSSEEAISWTSRPHTASPTCSLTLVFTHHITFSFTLLSFHRHDLQPSAPLWSPRCLSKPLLFFCWSRKALSIRDSVLSHSILEFLIKHRMVRGNDTGSKDSWMNVALILGILRTEI